MGRLEQLLSLQGRVAAECAPYNINVNAVAPGYYGTALN